MTRRMWCILCAGMLAGGLLTGCAAQTANIGETEISDLIAEETESPETTAETADTTEITETTSAETDTADPPIAEPEGDLAEARRALERYLDGTINGDAHVLLENSNIELFVLTWGGSGSAEYIEEWIEDLAAMPEPAYEYEIGAGREDSDMLAQYNESAQKRLVNFREFASGYEEVYSAETLARIEYFMQPIDAFYVFPVMTTDGESEFEDALYVIKLDGTFLVDMALTIGLFDWDDETDIEPAPEPAETRREIVIPEPVMLTEADLNEARNVLAKCLTYQNKCDLKALRKISNFEAMMLGSIGISMSGSDIGLLEKIMSEAEDYTYKIAPGKSVPEQLAQYNAHEKELLESEKFAALPERYTEQDVNMMRHFLKPAQALCEFSVTFSYADGATSTETWFVLMIDGEWIVDFGIVDNGLELVGPPGGTS